MLMWIKTYEHVRVLLIQSHIRILAMLFPNGLVKNIAGNCTTAHIRINTITRKCAYHFNLMFIRDGSLRRSFSHWKWSNLHTYITAHNLDHSQLTPNTVCVFFLLYFSSYCLYRDTWCKPILFFFLFWPQILICISNAFDAHFSFCFVTKIVFLNRSLFHFHK